MKSLSRLAWTVRYLGPGQVWHRVRRRARECWWRLTGATVQKSGARDQLVRIRQHAGMPEPGATVVLSKEERRDALALLQRLERDEFCFLNRTLSFRGGIKWDIPDASHLWRYHLHYFNYLEGLVILHAGGGPEAERAWEQFRRLVLCWIDSNAQLKGDGWHPYTISLRLVNWLNSAEAFFARINADPGFERRLVESLVAQASVLSDHLERDVRGNHLLENLKALIWAGTGLDLGRARGWLGEGLELLSVELTEQIRADGGHFERCPGYHVVVLQRLIQIGHRLEASTGAIPSNVEAAIRRMLTFLWTVRTPDGGVPLLKDTAFDAHPPVDEVLTEGALLLRERRFAVRRSAGIRSFLQFGLERVEWLRVGVETRMPPREGTTFLAESGYVCSRNSDEDYFIWDAGAPCPDYLPAHAHADVFTFDLWVRGRCWVVDSGVYEYTAGQWRDYFRATRAHSTLEVDGENQSDVYSSFRVGRRARVRGVDCREVRGGVFLAQGWHDGYQHLGAVHRRVLLFCPGRFWIVADMLSGRGDHKIQTRLQLHPEVEARERSNGAWVLWQGKEQLFLTASGYETMRVLSGAEAGWLSEAFGEKRRRCVLECMAASSLPFAGVHALAVDDSILLGEPKAASWGITAILVQAQGERYELRLPSDVSIAASVY